MFLIQENKRRIVFASIGFAFALVVGIALSFASIAIFKHDGGGDSDHGNDTPRSGHITAPNGAIATENEICSGNFLTSFFVSCIISFH